MKRTWKVTLAAILTLIGGIVGIVYGAFALLGTGVVAELTGLGWLTGIGGGLLALGILALIGAILMFKRKVWGYCLFAAICAMFPIIPLGVAAIIFVVMGKREFA
ncbi:MAG: hypothetical protein PHY18_00765 [Dehalococcoidales bacterium]|nr:hypothetical protein [Dehalococcoidales bacterium]